MTDTYTRNWQIHYLTQALKVLKAREVELDKLLTTNWCSDAPIYRIIDTYEIRLVYVIEDFIKAYVK